MSIAKEQYITEHFPNVAHGVSPAGNKIVVQLRRMKKKSSGGILLATETKDFNNENTQLGRLVSQGQIAYRHRETGERWKEGAWAKLGDIVLIPKWGGFRFSVNKDGDDIVFVILKDYEIEGVVDSNFESFDKIL